MNAREKAAATALAALVSSYDYFASKQFAAMTVGKTEAVAAAIRRRISASEKQTEKRMELYDAIREMMTSDRLIELLPEVGEGQVLSIRRALSTMDDDLSAGT